jgi:cellulose synthase/poly-beta-1,6-N-acetylglucosamine synthase-like glycosyltransferase
MLVLAYDKKQSVKKDYSYRSTVTVYLPTYNEEKTIGAKLDNLLEQDYPISEILIYDCSTDDTRKIVEDYSNKHSIIKLIKQPCRIGMARTFNAAVEEARGEILVKTDCDSLTLSKHALSKLIANFADKSVGAVSGIAVGTHGIEKRFRSVMLLIQRVESYLDSTFIAHSTSLLAFRRALLGPVKEDSMAEDTEAFMNVRKKGYRTIVEDAVVSIERVPDDPAVRRSQKSRRAQGIIKALFENITMLFNPKYGKYGLIVLPLELFILVISPLLLITIAALISYVTFTISPLLSFALLALFIITLKAKLGLASAIVDTQLNSLIATAMLSSRRNNPLWQKVR